MTDATPRRMPTWKILGILAVTVVAMLLIVAFWVRSATEARWARFHAEMKAGVERERARDRGRPSLHGSAQPGNAWDDYSLAIADMKKVQDRDKLGTLVDRAPKADPAWGATVMEQNGGILDSLRRGASRSTSRSPYDWEGASVKAMNDLLEANAVVNLAILKSRALLDAGKPRETVALLLDAAQFGRDVAEEGPLTGEMMGVAMLSRFLDEAREFAASEKADAPSLSDLELGLAVLEGSFPSHAGCLRREFLTFEMNLMNESQGGGSGGSRFGFLTKALHLNLLERYREANEQTIKACGRSWVESLATGKRVDDELRNSWNPSVRILALGQQPTEHHVRERLAQLRLLRVVTHYRRTGERLDLADPFGTTLKSAASGEGLKLWSIGANGVDDGGIGEWRPKVGADIVLEVRR